MLPSQALTSLPLLDDPFYLIGDLPVHTLVVHFAVVMLPLSAIALVAIILVPKWRGAFVWAAMVGLVIGTGAAFISKESGEQLADRIGRPAEHARWGDLLPYVGVLLLVTAVVWLWLERRAARADRPGRPLGSGLQLVVGLIAILLAAASIAMTIVVGHTGAAAVWESRSLDSEAQEDAQAPVPPPAPRPSGAPAPSGAPGFTAADVAAHATPADCWSIVNALVYDLTAWIPQHPGGAGVVEAMCGTDGTAGFEGQHAGDGSATDILASYEIGPVASAAGAGPPSGPTVAAPSPSATAGGGSVYTAADVAAHATPADCWSIVNGLVYDLTAWIPQHPGGAGVVEAMCGTDGTAGFEGQHAGHGSATDILASYEIGTLG